VEGFQQRLLALAHAYNLLTDNKWDGADLRDIVDATVAPYGTNTQISVDGAPVRLPPKQTLALAAALQELSTNAAKYGSLSVHTGKLDVRWIMQTDRLILDWTESAGPRVSPPTRQGFGTKLIQEVLSREADWTVEIEYRPEGLRCHLSLALTFDHASKRIRTHS
jgi:two-component sensor histidine kinase